jgi:hypothetical protein
VAADKPLIGENLSLAGTILKHFQEHSLGINGLHLHKNEFGKQLESMKKPRLGQKGLEVPMDTLLLK